MEGRGGVGSCAQTGMVAISPEASQVRAPVTLRAMDKELKHPRAQPPSVKNQPAMWDTRTDPEQPQGQDLRYASYMGQHKGCDRVACHSQVSFLGRVLAPQ